MLELPAVNWAPRRMFPPPITIAIWTPSWAARCTCVAMSTTSCMLMPRWPGAAKLSPESFRRMRLYGLWPAMVLPCSECGMGWGGVHNSRFVGAGVQSAGIKKAPAFAGAAVFRLINRFFTGRFAELPTDEFLELHPASSRSLRDRLFVVPDKWLFRENVFGVEIAHPAFDHLFDDVV